MNAIRKNCEQFDEGEWVECCKLFYADPDDHDPKTMIELTGLNRELFPYQAYAVYWMLKKEGTEAGGGFLSDEQGLGKTTEAIFLCIVTRMLQEPKEAVNKSAKQHPGSHLDNSEKQLPNSQCPSERKGEKPFGIACPCVRSSPSFKITVKAGPVLVVAPKALLETWKREFEAIIGKDNVYGMKLQIAHSEHKNVQKGFDPDVFKKTKRVVDRTQVIIVTTSRSFVGNVKYAFGQPLNPPPDLKDFVWKENKKATKEVNKINKEEAKQQYIAK